MPKSNSGPEPTMVEATASDVHHILGQTDDSTALAVALRPSVAQLEEARIWLDGAGDVLGKEHRPLDGVVAQIFDMLAVEDDEGQRSASR